MCCLERGEPILGPIRERYKQRQALGSLSLEECTDIIITLTEDRPLTTIVLVVLDECDETDRLDLLEQITKILQCSANLVRTFVSGCDDYNIVCQLTEYPNLEIEAIKL